MEFDPIGVARKPISTGIVKPMIRRIVDNEEDLTGGESTDQTLEESPKRLCIEYVGELIGKGSLIQTHGTEEMRGLALSYVSMRG